MMDSISIRVVSFENRTTRTGLRVPPRSTELPANFVCFVETGIVLDLPARTCAKGHKIQTSLVISHKKRDLVFNASAQVLEVTSSDGRDSVKLELVGFERPDWEWIQGIYRGMQANVSSLFRKLKG